MAYFGQQIYRVQMQNRALKLAKDRQRARQKDKERERGGERQKERETRGEKRQNEIAEDIAR